MIDSRVMDSLEKDSTPYLLHVSQPQRPEKLIYDNILKSYFLMSELLCLQKKYAMCEYQ